MRIRTLFGFTALLFIGLSTSSCEKCYRCDEPISGSGANICSTPSDAKAVKEDYESQGYICVEE